MKRVKKVVRYKKPKPQRSSKFNFYPKYKVIADPKTKRIWSFKENKYVKYKNWKDKVGPSYTDWPIMGFYCEMCCTYANYYKIYSYKGMSVCHLCLEKECK